MVEVHGHDDCAISSFYALFAEQKNITEELCGLLKAMTTDDSHQEIHIACKVYNATTNQVIKEQSPLLRDITISPRIQNFSPSSVPTGTEIRLEISVDVPSYLYVLNFGTSGSATMLLPNLQSSGPNDICRAPAGALQIS